MKPKAARSGFIIQSSHALVAIACVALLSSGNGTLLAQTPPATEPAVQPNATPEPEAPKIPNDQLDSLVAPIALYPDPLLAQTLAACTYPLEIILLEQWLEKNKNLKGKALADAVAKQTWDPSVQSMAGVPDALKRLANNIGWATDLGNAFLAQQQDVMAAVQRMRAKAQSKGALKTSKEQTVETQTVQGGGNEVIVIQQPNPEVVYVPSYDPAVVYGPPAYPYYPYSYPGYVPGMGLALGTGIALGAAWANNWGNCNWNNGGDININNNNNFNRNNINNVNRNNINNVKGNGNSWQHNSQHRGGAPYSNRTTANKYGGTARGGPKNTNRPAGDRASTRPSADGNRPGGDRSTANNRPGGDRSAANRPGGDRSSVNRPGGDRSAMNRPETNRQRPTGGDRIGNHQVSRTPSSRNTSAFGGASSGMNRSSAGASHSRGSRSMGGSRGGGRSGGGRRR
jgi:hypothetical protein